MQRLFFTAAVLLAVAHAQSSVPIVPTFVADVPTTVPWSVVAPAGGKLKCSTTLAL